MRQSCSGKGAYIFDLTQRMITVDGSIGDYMEWVDTILSHIGHRVQPGYSPEQP